ncbi:MAG: HEAT repeat domain-containing protein [Pyrinomonadaceae bacterium]
MLKRTAFGATDIGRRRVSNEDAWGLDEDLGLDVVADGMGGHAAGEIASREAVDTVIAMVRREKDLEVKAAVIIALGQTGNRSAVEPLVATLKRSPKEAEEFVRRAAARSIGQIAQINRTGKERVVTPQSFLPEKFKDLSGDDLTTQFPVFSAAVVTLSSVLQNQREADDTRRESAFALGSIGSRSSQLILRTAANSPDPYLAEIVREALAKIALVNPVN